VLAAWLFLIVHTLHILVEPLVAKTLLDSLGRWTGPWAALLIGLATFFVLSVGIIQLVDGSRTIAAQVVERGKHTEKARDIQDHNGEKG
jgi:hypothetical protein